MFAVIFPLQYKSLRIEAVVIETLQKDASVQHIFVKLASVADKLTIDAVVIETLLKEAFVDS